VVDVQSGEQTLVSTFEPVDLFVNQFLPFFDQYAKSHRIWSPDSDAIVLPVMRRLPGGGKMPRICVAPIDPLRGRLSEIADGIMAFWSPC
jgi:TolB protein